MSYKKKRFGQLGPKKLIKLSETVLNAAVKKYIPALATSGSMPTEIPWMFGSFINAKNVKIPLI